METFAFFSRVAASLKQLGLWGSFGIDEVCSKNAMSKVIIVDWTAPEGEEILMSWLNLPNVVRTGFCFSLRTCFKSMSITVKKEVQRQGRSISKRSSRPQTELGISGRSAISFDCEVSKLGWCFVHVFPVVLNLQFNLCWNHNLLHLICTLAMYSVH